MKFEVLKKNHLKRNIIIGILMIIVISAVILNFTKAKYRVTQSIPLVNGTINYSLADLEIIGLYINGEEANELNNNTKYTLDTTKSTCTYKDGSAISNLVLNYDSEAKTFTISPYTTKGTKCTLYFDISKDASSTIEELYPNNQLAYDDYNNLRYIGANPNNYVYFNCDDYNNPSENTCELWRIIGIFNEDTHGISGTKLIKLIRSESIGNYSWDENNVNNWTTASLQESLNLSYLNGTNLESVKGITTSTRDIIETVTWKLGGANFNESSNNLARNVYDYERGTITYGDSPITWNGKIALMYPSDYGYATSGGNTTNRTSCLAKNIDSWSIAGYSDCKNNNWLFDNNNYQWTLTSVSSNDTYVFFVSNNGNVGYIYAPSAIGAKYSFNIHPSIYLKSDIVITGGNGTISNPYTLLNK